MPMDPTEDLVRAEALVPQAGKHSLEVLPIQSGQGWQSFEGCISHVSNKLSVSRS
jgi:hypothetical protein